LFALKQILGGGSGTSLVYQGAGGAEEEGEGESAEICKIKKQNKYLIFLRSLRIRLNKKE
jgi:hypothetical protein